VTVWTTWAEEEAYRPDIVSLDKKLDEKLQKFFVELRKKDATGFSGTSITGNMPCNLITSKIAFANKRPDLTGQ